MGVSGSSYEPRHGQEQKLNIFIRQVVILRALKVLSRNKLMMDYKVFMALESMRVNLDVKLMCGKAKILRRLEGP